MPVGKTRRGSKKSGIAKAQTVKPASPKTSESSAQSLHHNIQHYPQTALRWVGDEDFMSRSEVLLCRHAPALDAILFIHGFGGDSGATWGLFPQVIGTMPEASKADVFFLDYPSTTSQVAFCAAQLRRFLVDLIREPIARLVQPTLPRGAPKRPANGRYCRVIIVAHSMGAVVARRALMDLERSSPNAFSEQELSKFRLLFFAPAHCGSTIPLLIASGLGFDWLPGAVSIGSLARLWFQALRDLEEGSPALTKLAEDCRRLVEERTQRGASIGHLRAQVYHAHNDRVVSKNDFSQDPPFEPVMGQSHRSICKPKGLLYVDPVEALRATLTARL